MAAWRFPFVRHTLLPVVLDDGTLAGMPGLRQAPSRDAHRVELVTLDGHGRLVFHLDREGIDELEEYEADSDLNYRVSCTSACPPAPCPRQHLTASDRPLEHLLHQQPRPHPAELDLLRKGGDPALSAIVSQQLRRRLARLPTPAAALDAHHAVTVPLTMPQPTATLPAPAAPPLPSRTPSGTRLTVELPLRLFSRVPAARSTDELAEALARQILSLLADGTARPCDVLYDTRGLAHALGGPRSTANGILILQRTAVRYGLIRNRPRQADDPPTPADLPEDHTMTWEISPAADLLAPSVAAELAAHSTR
ncbi:hypothetical protein OG613_48625 (plasmid) [Streptomyces sp. NBC_00015]|uniref:hypothetical protein n=1 Tax=Streptomyces sp. NBC_00015 TaxID=2903611 RepID=UPI00324AB3D1